MTLHEHYGDHKAYTRREFVRSGLMLASASVAVPAFIQRSAIGMPSLEGLSSLAGVNQDRILVVIQLSGGNDGLNMVIPFNDDAYYRARQGIALRGDDVHQLSKIGRNGADGVGLHRAMGPIRELYDEGLCSIVQGVGYPNPNRSHFKSMDIWHTADTSGTGDGWLGRYIDNECCGHGAGPSGQTPTADPPISIGRDAPLALMGRKMKPVAFETADLFRWTGRDIHESLSEPYDEITHRAQNATEDSGSNADFLTRTALDAQVSSAEIRRAVSQQPLVQYPRTQLGQQLQMVSSMIRAGLSTRVYYVSHGGFDTHSGQGGANGRHAQLLGQFAEATRAFYRELKEQGDDSRVLTMSFSEFGRRVGQNASGGTDHGTAAPMMLFGPMVNAGVIGAQPSLTDLDSGDLKFRIDFRSVYANVLDDWLGAMSRDVLGKPFSHTPVVKG